MDTYGPTPAAQMIENARRTAKMSVRKASESANLSEGRWRQIALGYQSAAQGIRIPVNTTPETLARMAAAVRLDEADLRAVDSDAADALAMSITRRHGIGVTLNADLYESGLTAVQAWLADGDPDGALHPPIEALWLWSPAQLALALSEQVEILERAFLDSDRERFQLLMQGKKSPQINETTKESDPSGDTTATKTPPSQPDSGGTVSYLVPDEKVELPERAAARMRPKGSKSPDQS